MNRVIAVCLFLLLVSPAFAQSAAEILIPPAPAAVAGGTGDVVGPASSIDLNLPRFSGTTGKLITNGSGINIPTSGTLSTSDVNGNLTLSPNGTGVVVLGKAITFSGITNDVTTGTNEAFTLVPNGTGGIVFQPGSNTILINDSGGGLDMTFTTSAAATRGTFCMNQACMGSSGNDFVHIGSSANRTATSGAWAASDSVSLGANTDLFTVYGEGKVAVNVQQSATCASTGSAALGALALDPTSSVVLITNSDPDGCVVTLAETSAVTGSDVTFIVVSSAGGRVTFASTAGIHAGPTCITANGIAAAETYQVSYAATLLQYVGHSCVGASSFSGAKVTTSVGTTVSTAANSDNTTLAFDGETYDTAAYHDNVTNNSRFTIPVTGYYQVSAQIGWSTASSAGERFVAIRLNATTLISRDSRASTSANNLYYDVATTQLFTAGDFVDLRVGQSSGGNLDTLNNTTFSITRLGF